MFLKRSLLFDQRSSLVDAPFDQICLDSEFLIRQKIDFCLERLIPRQGDLDPVLPWAYQQCPTCPTEVIDRKSTRLNSSHRCISYAVFCLKKKKKKKNHINTKKKQTKQNKTTTKKHTK